MRSAITLPVKLHFERETNDFLTKKRKTDTLREPLSSGRNKAYFIVYDVLDGVPTRRTQHSFVMCFSPRNVLTPLFLDDQKSSSYGLPSNQYC